MNIRPATVQDLPAILALVPRLATTGTPPGRDAKQIEASDIQSVTQGVTEPAVAETVLVAEESRALVGLIHLKTVTDYFSQQQIAHVADVVVAASAEGRGIGKALMNAAEEWARACGYPMIQLHVLVGNAPARALYERLGYSAEWLKYIKRVE
jgi:ribosomal protein S18 acetylase RimI-like enzyme